MFPKMKIKFLFLIFYLSISLLNAFSQTNSSTLSGFAKISDGITVTPSQIPLGQNFTVSFILKEIQGEARPLAEISTVSSIDTLAVLESLLQVLPRHLLDSKIIRLGDFGSFRISLSSSGADTAENFTKSMIKGVKLLFRPGKQITDELKQAEFVKI